MEKQNGVVNDIKIIATTYLCNCICHYNSVSVFDNQCCFIKKLEKVSPVLKCVH